MSRYWPLAGLRVRTERLELRPPTAADLDALADLAADGIHDPNEMPFSTPWTDAADLPAEVIHDPKVMPFAVAWTDATGLPYSALRDGTGEWPTAGDSVALTTSEHSPDKLTDHVCRAIGAAPAAPPFGTEMRAAVLHLAFEGLGARYARSGTLDGNGASLRVSEKNGYVPQGPGVRRSTTGRVPITGSGWTGRPGRRTDGTTSRSRAWTRACRCSGVSPKLLEMRVILVEELLRLGVGVQYLLSQPASGSRREDRQRLESRGASVVTARIALVHRGAPHHVGRIQVTFGNRAKSRSKLTIAAPCSSAIAASTASGTRSPVASPSAHTCCRQSRCRGPGSVAT